MSQDRDDSQSSVAALPDQGGPRSGQGEEGQGATERGDRQERMAETVRLIVTRREQAPRSPALERAFKRLIWRYNRRLHPSLPKQHDDIEGLE